MEEEERQVTYGQEPEEEEFAYSDYLGVTFMIQQYYYRTLELFRQYYHQQIRGKENLKLKQLIQSYVVMCVELMRNYTPIKKKKETNNLFSSIIKFIDTGNTMNFKKLTECVNTIIDAHYILGLGKLEFKRFKYEKPTQEIRNRYGLQYDVQE